jgi:hypothetical protein
LCRTACRHFNVNPAEAGAYASFGKCADCRSKIAPRSTRQQHDACKKAPGSRALSHVSDLTWTWI